ncbi:MAG: hypothetical protein PHW95_01155 [Patescibacteria group bacterium]|nr:hypothetical protein [Patescibacteria group bacterium]
MSDQNNKNFRELMKTSPEESPEGEMAKSRAEIEDTTEISQEQKDKFRTEVLDEIEAASRQPVANVNDLANKSVPAPPPDKSQTLVQVENILAQDLEGTFYQMDPDLKQRFKSEGEKTAAKIEALIKAGKGKAGAIFNLIIKWLKIIPGVNKFFIKQEAKIKTSKIINLNK